MKFVFLFVRFLVRLADDSVNFKVEKRQRNYHFVLILIPALISLTIATTIELNGARLLMSQSSIIESDKIIFKIEGNESLSPF